MLIEQKRNPISLVRTSTYLCESTGSHEMQAILTPRLRSAGAILAAAPISVVQTGVKSEG